MVLDVERGIKLASGDKRVWEDSIKIFKGALTKQLKRINEACMNGDYATIADIAHAIKGSASYCGAKTLQDTAEQLIGFCHDVEKEQVSKVIHDINKATSQFFSEVDRYSEMTGGQQTERLTSLHTQHSCC